MTTVRRPICNTCLRSQSACICHWVRPTPHTVEVVILQHPLEVTHAKGTARLLHLSLQHSTLTTGETFDVTTLHTLLYEPMGKQPASLVPRHTMLLYPDSVHDPVLGAPAAAPIPPATAQQPGPLRLIVLDATWRKSRKMLHCNPMLQHLPRLALRDVPLSSYHIRKAHQPHQLSTLEATCAALAQLTGHAAPFAPLLQAFDGFVTQQQGYRGAA